MSEYSATGPCRVGGNRAIADGDAASRRADEIDVTPHGRRRIPRDRTVFDKDAAAALVGTDCTAPIRRVTGESAASHREAAAGSDVNAGAVTLGRVADHGTLSQRESVVLE